MAEDLEQKLWDTELLLDRNGKVEFHEFLRVCVFVRFGVLGEYNYLLTRRYVIYRELYGLYDL